MLCRVNRRGDRHTDEDPAAKRRAAAEAPAICGSATRGERGIYLYFDEASPTRIVRA
jgi:hypothetical protein